VPLRIEIGPKDVRSHHVMMKSRLAGSSKETISLDRDVLVNKVKESLVQIHNDLFEAAEKRLREQTIRVLKYQDMVDHLATCDVAGTEADSDNAITTSPGLFLAPWYNDSDTEQEIKAQTRATIRCFPLEGQEEAKGQVCFYSGRPATHMAIFARSF